MIFESFCTYWSMWIRTSRELAICELVIWEDRDSPDSEAVSEPPPNRTVPTSELGAYRNDAESEPGVYRPHERDHEMDGAGAVAANVHIVDVDTGYRKKTTY